jgi:hypothetical protein
MMVVAGRHVGHRNAVTAGLRHLDIVSQRRATDRAQIDVDGLVRHRAQCAGNAIGSFQFRGMALAIAHAERMHGEPLLACEGEDDGGIHATGDEDDSVFHGIVAHWFVVRGSWFVVRGKRIRFFCSSFPRRRESLLPFALLRQQRQKASARAIPAFAGMTSIGEWRAMKNAHPPMAE